MTEIKDIKQAIQDFRDGDCSNFSNKQFIRWLESQAKENEQLRNDLHNAKETWMSYHAEALAQKRENDTLLTTIESQKEEIEQLRSKCKLYHGSQKTLTHDVFDQQNEINSLKAITELAVKCLKEELAAAKIWDMDGTARNIQATLDQITELTTK